MNAEQLEQHEQHKRYEQLEQYINETTLLPCYISRLCTLYSLEENGFACYIGKNGLSYECDNVALAFIIKCLNIAIEYNNIYCVKLMCKRHINNLQNDDSVIFFEAQLKQLCYKESYDMMIAIIDILKINKPFYLTKIKWYVIIFRILKNYNSQIIQYLFDNIKFEYLTASNYNDDKILTEYISKAYYGNNIELLDILLNHNYVQSFYNYESSVKIIIQMASINGNIDILKYVVNKIDKINNDKSSKNIKIDWAFIGQKACNAIVLKYAIDNSDNLCLKELFEQHNRIYDGSDDCGTYCHQCGNNFEDIYKYNIFIQDSIDDYAILHAQCIGKINLLISYEDFNIDWAIDTIKLESESHHILSLLYKYKINKFDNELCKKYILNDHILYEDYILLLHDACRNGYIKFFKLLIQSEILSDAIDWCSLARVAYDVNILKLTLDILATKNVIDRMIYDSLFETHASVQQYTDTQNMRDKLQLLIPHVNTKIIEDRLKNIPVCKIDLLIQSVIIALKPYF